MDKPYNKQVGETDKAFNAFKEFLMLGPERTLAKAGEKVGKSKNMLGRWSVKYAWLSRVEVWDKERETDLFDDLKKAAREANKRHVEIAKKLMELGIDRLPKVSDKKKIPINEARILITSGVQIERDALGIANEIKLGVNDPGKTISKITVEIIEPPIRKEKKKALK